ncbi:MAG: hypothetical protein AB7G93_09630 [Bdellovibrionales bacterium]
MSKVIWRLFYFGVIACVLLFSFAMVILAPSKVEVDKSEVELEIQADCELIINKKNYPCTFKVERD